MVSGSTLAGAGADEATGSGGGGGGVAAAVALGPGLELASEPASEPLSQTVDPIPTTRTPTTSAPHKAAREARGGEGSGRSRSWLCDALFSVPVEEGDEGTGVAKPGIEPTDEGMGVAKPGNEESDASDALIRGGSKRSEELGESSRVPATSAKAVESSRAL